MAKKPKRFNDTWCVWDHTDQGRRSSMEDNTSIRKSFLNERGLFVGVFDGHNGSLCSQFICQEIPTQIEELFEHKVDHEEKRKSIENTFQYVDCRWLEKATKENLEDGSTAICLLAIDEDVFVANVGDSRAYKIKGGRAYPMSKDHKPESEKERIMHAGGVVIGGRLQGKLDVSRSFGDRAFKEQDCGLICVPDIEHVSLKEEDIDYFVLACDGLYESFDCDEIAEKLSKSTDPSETCKFLVDEAIDRGSEDNISVIIVKPPFIDKKPKKKKEKEKNQKESLLEILKNAVLPTRDKTTSVQPTSKTAPKRPKSPPKTSSLNNTQMIIQSSGKKLRKSNSSSAILKLSRSDLSQEMKEMNNENPFLHDKIPGENEEDVYNNLRKDLTDDEEKEPVDWRSVVIQSEKEVPSRPTRPAPNRPHRRAIGEAKRNPTLRRSRSYSNEKKNPDADDAFPSKTDPFRNEKAAVKNNELQRSMFVRDGQPVRATKLATYQISNRRREELPSQQPPQQNILLNSREILALSDSPPELRRGGNLREQSRTRNRTKNRHSPEDNTPQRKTREDDVELPDRYFSIRLSDKEDKKSIKSTSKPRVKTEETIQRDLFENNTAPRNVTVPKTTLINVN